MNFDFRLPLSRFGCILAGTGLLRLFSTLVVLSFVSLTCFIKSSPASDVQSRTEDEIHVRYRIEEEVPRGTIVGSVIEDANLRSRHSASALQQIRFRFLAEPSSPSNAASPVSTSGSGVSVSSGTPSIAPAGLFEIGSSSGIIRTASDLDRDSPHLCRQRRRCEVNIDVVAQPVQFFRIIKVTVEIVDINDNAPRFRDSEIVLSINEAALPGSLYPLPTAVDWDSPDQNGVQRYELDFPLSSGDHFALQVGRKLDGTADLKLHLRDRLDRETSAEYRVRLIAYDGGSKSGATTLVIAVADSNDNRPEFISGSGTSGLSGDSSSASATTYEFTIVENLPTGTVVGRVKATDRDAGPNGLVTYEIIGPSGGISGGGSSSSGSSLGGSLSGYRERASSSSQFSALTRSSLLPFVVDNATGEIIVRGSVDRETADVHRFVVAARDNGPDQMSAEATVVIYVDDLNDNAPTVTVHTLSGSDSASSGTSAIVAEIPEDSPIGSFVAYVSAVDPDDGPNGRVDCELVGSEGGGDVALSTFGLVQKYENEYQIATSAELDRERRAEYVVAVRCRDNGSPSARIGEKTVRIAINDINDNSPVFSQQTYRGSLLENNVIGLSVLQVTAMDWDSGENSRVQYSIPGNVGQMFHVDQYGVVSVHVVVDRERYDSFRFPILAVDRGSSTGSLTGSALVIISIQDLDDERPRFLQSHYVFGVYENEPQDTEVGSVLAEDRDGPPFNSFRYAYHSGDLTADEFFMVDPSSGTIRSRRPLDRERKPQYRFVVIAYDPKSYLMSTISTPSSTATVTVNVLDRNDNAPFFVTLMPTIDNASSAMSIVHVPGRAPIGHVLATASARDDDIDDAGRVAYSLRAEGDGSDEAVELFRIDPTNGALVVDADLLPVLGQSFLLVVVATDGGVPPLSASMSIVVVVNGSMLLVVDAVDQWNDGAGSVQVSSASSYGHNARMTTFNLVVVVAIVCGCSVVVFALIMTIALVRSRSFRRRQAHKYNCRMEALRMITSGSAGCGADGILPEMETTIGAIASASPSGTPTTRTWNGSIVVTRGDEANNSGAAPSKFSSGNGNISGESGGDQDSIHSVEGDGSVTDSGRGPSEEGEGVSALATNSSVSTILGVSGMYSAPGSSTGTRTRPHRDRAVPPPPPPPRPGAVTYWAHQQPSSHQPTIIISGASSCLHHMPHHHHHRGTVQSHPTVRFHGLSTTIPEEEILGDCPPPGDNEDDDERRSNSMTTVLSASRQTGRRSASLVAGYGGSHAGFTGRSTGQRSSRGHVGGTEVGSGSEARALLFEMNFASGHSDCGDERSERGVDDKALPIATPLNSSADGGDGDRGNESEVGWSYHGSAIIV